MTDNPIAAALKARLENPENNASPFVTEAEREYVATRILAGGDYVRTETTEDGRNVFGVVAQPSDVKSYNELMGEHIRAGIYIGDDNQVTWTDNPLQAGIMHAKLAGRIPDGMQVEMVDIGKLDPCDDPDCKNCHPDGGE